MIRPYMFYVYILRSQIDKKFYIGYSGDLKRRFLEHNAGQVISTSKRRPLDLVMYEAYQLKQDAQARERFFKTTKGKLQLRKQVTFYLLDKCRLGSVVEQVIGND